MDLSGSSTDAGMNDMANLLDAVAARTAEPAARTGINTPFPLDVDHSRDALLTDFGK